jgi:hypothetical protein
MLIIDKDGQNPFAEVDQQFVLVSDSKFLLFRHISGVVQPGMN